MAETVNYCVVKVDGTAYTDVKAAEVKSNIGDNNASSSFAVTFDNFDGQHKTSFTVNDEVEIHSTNESNPYADLGGSSWENKVFLGIIEKIETIENQSGRSRIKISGRDYSARMQDITVSPTVYNDDEVSVIVTNLMTTYLPDITLTNVNVTTTTIGHITFNQKTVFDAIQELAELSGFYFYIDVNKDLNFKEKDSISSGKTLDSTNITYAKFIVSDRDVYNQVWVYGDRTLTKWQDSFTADGAGSEFTLDYKPHNTDVVVNGVKFDGGVFELTSVPGTGVQYLVDYDQQQITFTSGTEAGNNIPGSASGIVIDYDKSTPIVKFAASNESISLYGKRSKVIVDKNITQAETAKAKALNFLNDNSSLKTMGTLTVREITDITPGTTVVVDVPNQNIDSQTYKVLESVYKFNERLNLRFENLTVRVSRKVLDITDTIKSILQQLRELQASELQATDVVTRLETATGSAGMRVSDWTVTTRPIGTSFIFDHPVNGRLGSVAGVQPILGDHRGMPLAERSMSG